VIIAADCKKLTEKDSLMSGIKQGIKNGINFFLERGFHHRLMHSALALDSAAESLQSLADAGMVFRHAVDVGAARGEWTQAMLTRLPKCHFTMIEPLAENLAYLDVVQVKSGGRADYRHEAVGRQSGTLVLNVHSDQTSSFASEWGGTIREVPVQRLDDRLADGSIPAIDLIKLDVQGAELDVLAGAEKTLAACQAVQMEISFRRVYKGAPLAHEIVAYMADKGFRVFDICDTIKRREDRALLQADLVLAREGKWFLPETWHR